LPEGAEFSALDPDVKRDFRGLPHKLAERVGAHVVAAGMLLDHDSRRALDHARFAKSCAPRVPAVREAVALAAYQAGEWSAALSELRAVRRMTGSHAHAAMVADCERALGRPERALELARNLRGAALGDDVALELRIVAAGARRDMGQPDAALRLLEAGGLHQRPRHAAGLRLLYAYADALVAAGRERDAIAWFASVADADGDELTDAADRAMDLAAQVNETAGGAPHAQVAGGSGQGSGSSDPR
jgi:tetratricopeptide (TPR) repeat protein